MRQVSPGSPDVFDLIMNLYHDLKWKLGYHGRAMQYHF